MDKVSRDHLEVNARISKVANESIIQKTQLSDTIQDAKVLEGRLESTKTVIEKAMSEADEAYGRLQAIMSQGFHGQTETRNMVQHLIGKSLDGATTIKLEGRIAVIENIMAASSSAMNDAMNDLGMNVQTQMESLANQFVKYQCKCPGSCPGITGGAREPPTRRAPGEVELTAEPSMHASPGGQQRPMPSANAPPPASAILITSPTISPLSPQIGNKVNSGQDLTKYSNVFVAKFKDEMPKFDGKQDGEGQYTGSDGKGRRGVW